MNYFANQIMLEEAYEHDHIAWGRELDFPNTKKLRQATHRIFNRYPARSISLVPRAILLSTLKQRNTRNLRVLDPFMGSGTTAVEAQLFGLSPLGVEVDPFARLIAQVRTTRFDLKLKLQLEKTFETVMRSWRRTRPDTSMFPKLAGIEYWFRQEELNDLQKLKTIIYLATKANTPIRDFLRITLADIVRPCSRAERQTLKPYISKRFAKTPSPVGETFAKSFTVHLAALNELDELAHLRRKPLKWIGEDATEFRIAKPIVDIAITSPPYINALDYVRCIKLESAWIDTGNDETFNKVRRQQVGERTRASLKVDAMVDKTIIGTLPRIAKLDKDRARTVRAYFNDLLKNLQCVFEALVPGGSYHLIVGDSVIRGVEVPTHQIIANMGENIGFKWSNYYSYRIKDHRTSIPRKNHGGKIEFEHVVSLKKE